MIDLIANQDKMAVGLIKGDGRAAWSYMNGQSNNINAAINALAIWASIPTVEAVGMEMEMQQVIV